MKSLTRYVLVFLTLVLNVYGTRASAQEDSLLPSTTLAAGWAVQHFGTAIANVDNGGQTNGLSVTISQVDGTDWHAALVSPSVNLVDGTSYTLSFVARASVPTHINYNCTITDGDYHSAGLYSGADLTTVWHRYRCAFQASKATGFHERFDFLMGNNTGTVWISSVKLKEGAPQALNDDSSNPNSWVLATTDPAHATMQQDGDALKVSTTTVDGTNWHVQIYQTGIDLVAGQSYILTFDIKADQLRTIPLSVINETTYQSAGLFLNINLAPSWQTISYTFKATSLPGQLCRLPDLDLGSQTGVVWVKNATLTPTN